MKSSTNPTGKELQALFRVGKYAICQIPMNIVLGEVGLDSKGNERIIQSTKTYHSSYFKAMEKLYEKLVLDKMTKSTVDLIKSLMNSIEEAKKEIIQTIKEQ